MRILSPNLKPVRPSSLPHHSPSLRTEILNADSLRSLRNRSGGEQINAQIVKPAERLVLSRLVQVMIAHKLRFFQERGEDGKLSYRLDPLRPSLPLNPPHLDSLPSSTAILYPVQATSRAMRL